MSLNENVNWLQYMKEKLEESLKEKNLVESYGIIREVEKEGFTQEANWMKEYVSHITSDNFYL